ncbi:laminin subunit beta-1 isoform X1 [Hemiscyllium ocellatum]|nr:laminin subunit beta-1 isoform X1 [Hemiscyllium ocellatum]XP_060691278.1 laminin subunit beta-1 isoform X1 [Hemiscyllium ocellatum]
MTRLLALLLFAGSCFAQDLPSLPHGCTEGSCYPATGNLLIGRAHNLTASSTCGMEGPSDYCIVSHLQEVEKCFQCDSRRSYDAVTNRNSHRIRNVIYLTDQREEKTWWQSENGEEKVNIQLDLEAEFHFTHLIMKFKTFRPAAMYIERSSDFGRTWKVYRYFAFNCTVSFPHIPTGLLRRIDDVICEHRYSDIEPSTDGEVIYKVLDPAIKVADPYSLEIQDLLRITNLKIHFTKLHTLGDNLLDRRMEVLQKYYYALFELVVRGSCFCYGHASECSPVAGVQAGVPGMIHGRCTCKHNTKGLNCEQCKNFYHELPWRPAEVDNPHACKECNCNKHATSCHFDMAVYIATGNLSGGVCENCQHNTMGRNCELCKPFYYRNPTADIRSEDACIPCDCDPVGSLEGGICDSDTDLDFAIIGGQCRCKENVRGTRCDRCKEGFYGLSMDNPHGCQACRCDPRGVILSTAPCDAISGDCFCKRYVTGRYCDLCLPEYWGLSNDMAGCRQCDCDFGGAYNNRCSMESGQCDCRPNIISRRCQDVEPGFFCMPLDFYTYEAEKAEPRAPTDQLPGAIKHQVNGNCIDFTLQHGLDIQEIVRRRRQHRQASRVWASRHRHRRIRQRKVYVEIVNRKRPRDQMITWSGPGFARVQDGAGLLFHVSNIPYAMDYNVMVRYEPESAEDWEAIISIHTVGLPISHRCGNLLPHGQPYRVALRHTERYVMVSTAFCFEPNIHYEISIRYQRLRAPQWNTNSYLLVDSLVLLPKYSELPGFAGRDPVAVHHREEMVRYMCLDSFMMASMPMLAEMCVRLICSISAIMHDGALPCQCDPQGSISSVCEKMGGQCECRNNVIGRQCDQCAPGHYGFGPYGCSPCDCNPEGSVHGMCDQMTGQCHCRAGARGRQCDQCYPQLWGFPTCQPCHCNGHSEDCDSQTGACLNCRDNTSGHHCQRCSEGYYGNPVLGFGEQCRPCPCPHYPGSDHYHGLSCHADLVSDQIVCYCQTGYTGSRCDVCAPGYYGNPEVPGGKCWPCQCNNNIDLTDPGACHPDTGECLKCLYNTDGPHCEACKAGYYGNALQHDCRGCTCNFLGTLESECNSREYCHCDRTTGHCPCRENVVGKNCDKCRQNYWNFGSLQGCEPCRCQPEHSQNPHCNMFTGQCECRPGLGGQTCSECQEGYWGNPALDCRACDCDPDGSEIQQCDRSTGRCLCKEGFTGPRCDQCNRGYHGRSPSCARCHPCFDLWDEKVKQLGERLRALKEAVHRLTMSGAAGAGNDSLQELEKKLQHVETLLHEEPLTSARTLDQLNRLAESLRKEMKQLSQRMDTLTEDTARTEAKNNKAERDINQLEEESRILNMSLIEKTKELQKFITSNFKELYDSMLKSYQESCEAERVVNGSVSGPHSPIVQSEDTRHETERLLQEQENTFRKSMAAQRKQLKDLENKVKELMVESINEKVCGSSRGQSCDTDPCGGANCQDDAGNRQCGGESCSGALSESMEALQRATNSTIMLQDIQNQLDSVSQRIEAIHSQAEEAKSKAAATLQKASNTKNHITASVDDLRKFIKAVKDFLNEEGADPESIELLANMVLNISFPVSLLDIRRILQDIKDTMANIKDVDTILNDTSQNLQLAQQLLQRAEKVKNRAAEVNGDVTDVKLNVEDANSKLALAEESLQKARNNTAAAEDSIKKLDTFLNLIESQLMKMMERFENLSTGVQMLENQTIANRNKAQDLRSEVSAIRKRTNRLHNNDLKEVERRYEELRDKISLLGNGTEDGNERAKKIKEEAEKLRNRATDSLQKLNALEKKFNRNKQVMTAKLDMLQDLEQNVTDLLEYIRERSQYYGFCS